MELRDVPIQRPCDLEDSGALNRSSIKSGNRSPPTARLAQLQKPQHQVPKALKGNKVPKGIMYNTTLNKAEGAHTSALNSQSATFFFTKGHVIFHGEN